MPTAHQQQAADLIWQLWQKGEVTADLPSSLKPTSRAEGYAIQATIDARSPKPRVGWKIAATSVAGQTHIGVDGPLAGRIPAERVIAEGATVSIAANRMRVAEPEFCFRLGRDLPPRATAYSVDDVMAAVGDLHLAIELPDSRVADFAKVGGPTLIADDACAHQLMIGSKVTADWRSIDLARHKVKGHMRGGEIRDGIGSNVLGDPRVAMTWIANELSTLGVGLKSGEFVTTGTCMVPIAISPGDHIRADFGVLGSISITLA